MPPFCIESPEVFCSENVNDLYPLTYTSKDVYFDIYVKRGKNRKHSIS